MTLLAAGFLRRSAADNPPALFGFNATSSQAERSLEEKFDASLNPEDQKAWLQKLSARPHHIGSPYQAENSKTILDLFTSWGFDAKIENFQVLFPTPLHRLLELEGPHGYRAGLAEPEVPQDVSTRYAKEALPPYNAYSCDGDVKGKLVYVNFGLPKDYEELERQGIDVKGKIVIARYGASWRGVKPKVAAEHGAIGCILFTDPHDDGFFQGETYPEGPWRSEYSVQRGSVDEMTLYPGDPLTPGVGAVEGAKRLDLKDVKVITKIPTLPIGWKDALPLISNLQGPVAPSAWRGALPVTYRIGPSKDDVHLSLKFKWGMVDAHDVVAKLSGSQFPDQWVVRGNHYDGWVCGAEDPLSGQVALLSEAKALGELAKTGWRPKRTIIYCAWDGEEPGLLGSTEWAETHADVLNSNAVAYINSDSNGRGFVGAEGSPVLSRFFTSVAADVPDPETHMSVLERAWAREKATGSAEAKKRATDKEDLELGALGSGSDYSSFIQHLGIPALDISYGGESEGTQYHSSYDTFDWYTRFVDPTFEYGVALSKTVGRTVLRLANADALPFDHHRLVKDLQTYAREVEELLKTTRTETEETNKMLADGTLAAAADPTKHLNLPKAKDPAPSLDFGKLNASIARLAKAVDAYEDIKLLPVEESARLDPDRQTDWNNHMLTAERKLLGPGLPGRPWYRHVVTAPGEYTGYGAKTLPGIREAIEARNWKRAQEQIEVAAETIDGLSAFLEK